ncbi:MAG TPA: hypothetical protein PKI15_10995, partial [Candidatus Cloacimonadota bacterium]|nr:hypothetical protein [Candidatus Cloacimonadota bacterium]
MNRTCIILCILLAIATSSLIGQWVNHTKTISAIQLSDIRTATDAGTNSDSFIAFLWGENNNIVRADTTFTDDSERSYSNTFGFETISLTTFIRVILDAPETTNSLLPFLVSEIRTSLDNFDWHDFKLAIYNPREESYNSSTHNGWGDGWSRLSTYDRGRELCYSLLFYALTVDLLYYGSTSPAEQAQMDSILVDLADMRDWAYNTFLDHDPAEWDNLGWQDNDLVAQPVGYCIDYGPEPQLPEIAFQV